MANCPSCHAALTEDFGLIECLSCGAPLIIHVDGSVEAAAPAKPPPAPKSLVFDQSGATPDATFGANGSAPAAEEDLFALSNAGLSPMSAPGAGGGSEYGLPEADHSERGASQSEFPDSERLEFDGPEDGAPEDESPHYEAGSGASADESAADGDSLNGIPDPVDELFAEDQVEAKPDIFAEEEAPAPVPHPSAASPDLSDIARFGNSETMGSRDGTLRYNLVVGGIDTSDVREAFREALTDRKFMWDTDEILRAIHDGEVRIENIMASKAFVLVSRLRTLPVRIQWEQYVVQSN